MHPLIHPGSKDELLEGIIGCVVIHLTRVVY